MGERFYSLAYLFSMSRVADSDSGVLVGSGAGSGNKTLIGSRFSGPFLGPDPDPTIIPGFRIRVRNYGNYSSLNFQIFLI